MEWTWSLLQIKILGFPRNCSDPLPEEKTSKLNFHCSEFLVVTLDEIHMFCTSCLLVSSLQLSCQMQMAIVDCHCSGLFSAPSQRDVTLMFSSNGTQPRCVIIQWHRFLERYG